MSPENIDHVPSVPASRAYVTGSDIHWVDGSVTACHDPKRAHRVAGAWNRADHLGPRPVCRCGYCTDLCGDHECWCWKLEEALAGASAL